MRVAAHRCELAAAAHHGRQRVRDEQSCTVLGNTVDTRCTERAPQKRVGCAQDISPTSFNTLQGLVGGAAGTIQCREGMCLRVCDTGTGDECPEVPFCDEDPTGQNCPPIAS